MGFSKRLKLLRKNADVTQDELAQYLQVSRSTIAGYETKNRQPDYDKLYMIAQFFHVSTDYLISGSDIRPVEVSTVDSSMNERMLKYHLRTIYATLSLKSKQDLLMPDFSPCVTSIRWPSLDISHQHERRNHLFDSSFFYVTTSESPQEPHGVSPSPLRSR